MVSSLVNSSFLIHLACSSACCFCLEARWSSISKCVILVCDLSKSLLKPSISILAWLSFISTSASFSESFRSSLCSLFFSFCREFFSSSTSSSLSFRDSNFSCHPSSLVCRNSDLFRSSSSLRWSLHSSSFLLKVSFTFSSSCTRHLHSSSFLLKVSLSFCNSFSTSAVSLASLSSETWRRKVVASAWESFSSRRVLLYLDFVSSCSSSFLSKLRSRRFFSLSRELNCRFRSSCFFLQFSPSSFVFSLAFKSAISASRRLIFSSSSFFSQTSFSLSLICKSSSSFNSSLRNFTSSSNFVLSFFKSSFSSQSSPYIFFPFSNFSSISSSSSLSSVFSLDISSFSFSNFSLSSRTLLYFLSNCSYFSL